LFLEISTSTPLIVGAPKPPESGAGELTRRRFHLRCSAIHEIIKLKARSGVWGGKRWKSAWVLVFEKINVDPFFPFFFVSFLEMSTAFARNN
jgi:hypothetical protein